MLTASESLYGFAAWASSLNPNNEWDNCALWAELVDEFCKANHLPEPRENWTDHLTHPPATQLPNKEESSRGIR